LEKNDNVSRFFHHPKTYYSTLVNC